MIFEMAIWIDAKDRTDAIRQASQIVEAVTRSALPTPSFVIREVNTDIRPDFPNLPKQ